MTARGHHGLLLPAAGGTPTDPLATSILAKLTCWWELTEASGTRADSHGSSPLTVTGTVSTATGVRGDTAASFAGSGHLTGSNATALQVPSGGGDHCLFGWFYVASNTGQGLMGKWNGIAASGMEYVARVDSSNVQMLNGGSAYRTAAVAAPAAGNWYFYTGWRDSADGLVRACYNNGTVGVAPSSSNPSAGSSSLALGASSHPTNSQRMTGRLQRWGWIKGAYLTYDERNWLYNSGNGRTYAELVAAA